SAFENGAPVRTQIAAKGLFSPQDQNRRQDNKRCDGCQVTIKWRRKAEDSGTSFGLGCPATAKARRRQKATCRPAKQQWQRRTRPEDQNRRGHSSAKRAAVDGTTGYASRCNTGGTVLPKSAATTLP